eukprot:387411_1
MSVDASDAFDMIHDGLNAPVVNLLNESFGVSSNWTCNVRDPLSFLNENTDDALVLLTQANSAVSRIHASGFTSKVYRKFLKNKKRLLETVNLGNLHQQIQITTFLHKDRYEASSMEGYAIFYYENNSRYKGSIIGKRGMKTKLSIRFEDETKEIDVTMSTALSQKQVILIEKVHTVDIFSPSLYLPLWINSPYRRKYWLHSSTNASSTPLDYINTYKGQHLDICKRQNYNFVMNTNNKPLILRIGCAYLMTHNRFIIIRDFRFEADETHLHQSNHKVLYHELWRQEEFMIWLQNEDIDNIDLQRLLQSCRHDPDYVLVPDLRTNEQLAANVHDLNKQIICMIKLNFIDDCSHGSRVPMSVNTNNDIFYYIICVTNDMSLTNESLYQRILKWKLKASGFEGFFDEFDDDVHHLAPYCLWIDGMDKQKTTTC